MATPVGSPSPAGSTTTQYKPAVDKNNNGAADWFDNLKRDQNGHITDAARQALQNADTADTADDASAFSSDGATYAQQYQADQRAWRTAHPAQQTPTLTQLASVPTGPVSTTPTQNANQNPSVQSNGTTPTQNANQNPSVQSNGTTPTEDSPDDTEMSPDEALQVLARETDPQKIEKALQALEKATGANTEMYKKIAEALRNQLKDGTLPPDVQENLLTALTNTNNGQKAGDLTKHELNELGVQGVDDPNSTTDDNTVALHVDRTGSDTSQPGMTTAIAAAS